MGVDAYYKAFLLALCPACAIKPEQCIPPTMKIIDMEQELFKSCSNATTGAARVRSHINFIKQHATPNTDIVLLFDNSARVPRAKEPTQHKRHTSPQMLDPMFVVSPNVDPDAFFEQIHPKWSVFIANSINRKFYKDWLTKKLYEIAVTNHTWAKSVCVDTVGKCINV